MVGHNPSEIQRFTSSLKNSYPINLKKVALFALPLAHLRVKRIKPLQFNLHPKIKSNEKSDYRLRIIVRIYSIRICTIDPKRRQHGDGKK